MRQLFLKIFLSVLLTVLLTFAGGIAIAIWVMPNSAAQKGASSQNGAPRPDRADFKDNWRARMTDMLDLHARQVEQLLAHEGPEAVLAHMQHLLAVWGVHAQLLDDAGAEVGGNDLPQRTLELARRVQAGREVQNDDTNDTVALAARFKTADGTPYVFVAEAPAGSFPPPPPSLAWMLALRLIPIAIGLGLVSFLLARYITSPVLKLRATLRRFGEGDLDLRVGTSIGRRRDEIGELARDFDHMAERIATLLDAQRRLLRDVSHELRTPLARQRVALELARRENSAEAAKALDRAEREGERLDELIGELLTLSRLENDTESAQRVPLELSDLVREVTDNAAYEAHNGNRSVHIAACAPCTISAVPELLRRAVENVVRNALAYTAEKTTVHVALQCDAHDAVISVRDHGPGVPDADLAHIFRPFYRVSQARERQTGGAGLGLAIAERAVRFHGGRVIATNHPEGGLVVEIQLPREVRSQ